MAALAVERDRARAVARVAGMSAGLELWRAAGMQLGGEDNWQESGRAEMAGKPAR